MRSAPKSAPQPLAAHAGRIALWMVSNAEVLVVEEDLLTFAPLGFAATAGQGPAAALRFLGRPAFPLRTFSTTASLHRSMGDDTEFGESRAAVSSVSFSFPSTSGKYASFGDVEMSSVMSACRDDMLDLLCDV